MLQSDGLVMNCVSIIQTTAENTDVSVYLGVLHFVNSSRVAIMSKALDEAKPMFESEGITPEGMKAELVETNEGPDREAARLWGDSILVMLKGVAKGYGGDPDLFIIGPIIGV